MKKSFFLLQLSFLAITAFIAIPQEKTKTTPGNLKSWVEYLASDEMRGRANGSPEMKTAAEWIRERFREYGLKPAGTDGQYIQKYSYMDRQKTTIPEQNVIGIIDGSDPALKDQYIVLSAHFDHVGVRKGSQPDSIYNGADDNAAGTCTLIGIAKTIKELNLKPGRTIVFAAFRGEENGMRGSRYFVANPSVTLKNVYADLNFEMTGHSESYGKNNYYMTGCSLSDLDDVISEFSSKTGFILIDTVKMAERLFYASDNIAFSRISSKDGITSGIPSGTFATTTMASHVHSPDDEAEYFDFDNMAALVNHFSEVVIWLSNNKTEISWTNPKFTRLR